MRYYSHIATSVAVSLAVTQATDTKLALPTLAGIIVGSLLPDIDEPKSYVGNRSMGASYLVKGIFGHRGFTHSILAVLIMLIPLYWIIHSQSYVISVSSLLNYEELKTTMSGALQFFFLTWYGIVIGYILHILEDMCSVSGVPLLYPLSKRIRIPIYRTGKGMEKIIFLISIGYIIYIAKDMVLFS